MSERPHEHATRVAYDGIAGDYADRFAGELAEKPFARAMLDVFAELVGGGASGDVLDVGCGPGTTTAYLHARGLRVAGLDLSPAMVEQARTRHPRARFTVGTIAELDADDGELAGIVAWYSIVHVPPPDLPPVLTEFARALRRGGRLLLAFQVGDEPLHLTEAFGRGIALDFHRYRTDDVSRLLARSGFTVTALLDRAADEEERTPHAHVLATRR